MVGLALLLFGQATVLPPIICDGPEAQPEPHYLCEADKHAQEACFDPVGDDARPITLCLAVTYDDDVERELRKQLAAALARARDGTGAGSRSRLRAQQRHWERGRARTCRREAAMAPVPEQARADLTCQARQALPRVEQLTELARSR